MMNYEEKRKYLESFAYLDLEIEIKLCEKKKWLDRALKITQSESEDIPVSTCTNRIINKVIELERNIDELIDRVIDRRNFIVERIERLDDMVLKQILFEKYINSKSMEQIGEEMGYCEKQISRKHKKAIELLDLN